MANVDITSLKSLKNKRILITGGMGFIGSSLVKFFVAENKVTIFDNGRRNAFQFLDPQIQKRVKVVTGDMLNQDLVSKVVQNQDIIIHLAAIAGASFYEKEPLLTFDVNFHGTENILRAVTGKKVEKVIVFSSSEVCGSLADHVSESDPTSVGPADLARWSYAASKLASEHLAFGYFRKHGVPIVIVRPFNIYGPLQVGEGAITGMIKGALINHKIQVTGNGRQKRAWCYIDDMVNAITRICFLPVEGNIYNIGNSETSLTILELAQKIQKLGERVDITFIDAVKAEILDRSPNIDKAKRDLGFVPFYDLDQGLELTFDWIKNNLKALKD